MEYTLRYEKEVLDNGLTVCYRVVDAPDTALRIRINRGRLYEDEEKAGITHFLEHMLFKSTRYHSGDEIREELENITGRDIIATTTHEQVSLDSRCPNKELKILTEILYECIANYYLKEEDVEKEREIVLKEVSMNENDPFIHFFSQQKEKLFPQHPYGKFVGGTSSAIKNITTQDLIEEKKKGFVGSNIYISAVGGIDVDEFLSSIESSFGKMEKGIASSYDGEIKPPSYEEIEGEVGAPNQLLILLQAPGYRDSLKMEVLHEYLAEGRNSQLYRRLREEKPLCYHFGATLAKMNDRSIYAIVASNYDINKEREIIDIIINELDSIARGNIKMRDLERIKNNFRKTFYERYMDSVSSQADVIIDIESRKTPYSLDDMYSFFSNFSSDELIETAKKYFNGNYLVLKMRQMEHQ
ncbi:MAG: pitrilysin family protein [Candidatus Aenigmatarchaeota archaeon]